MNRFLRWPSGAVAPFGARPEQAAASVEHRIQNYTLLAPHHFEPDYAYPLLVWLHGPDDDERQLRHVMKYISLRNYVAVGPRGCCAPEEGRLGFQWRQLEPAIAAAEQRVFDAIDSACQQFRVDEERLFLAGYQCGGTMALRIGLRHPERFAGAASIGGPFPTGHAPLAQLRRSRRLPLLIAQGRDSELYPLRLACGELRLFHAAGMHVTVRQYPCGDELTTRMLQDLNVWMMEQVQGAVEADRADLLAYPGDAN